MHSLTRPRVRKMPLVLKQPPELCQEVLLVLFSRNSQRCHPVHRRNPFVRIIFSLPLADFLSCFWLVAQQPLPLLCVNAREPWASRSTSGATMVRRRRQAGAGVRHQVRAQGDTPLRTSHSANLPCRPRLSSLPLAVRFGSLPKVERKVITKMTNKNATKVRR